MTRGIAAAIGPSARVLAVTVAVSAAIVTGAPVHAAEIDGDEVGITVRIEPVCHDDAGCGDPGASDEGDGGLASTGIDPLPAVATGVSLIAVGAIIVALHRREQRGRVTS